MWRVTNYFQYFIVQAMCSLPSFFSVFFPFTDSSGCNEKTNSNNFTSLPKARNHKNKQVQKLRHTQARTLIQKLKNYPLQKKMYHCLWYHPVPPLFPFFFFFFYFSFLSTFKHIPCFFLMGRGSIKNPNNQKDYQQDR